MAKIALLIGISNYPPGLDPLPVATKDITAMQQVLANPAIGDFAPSDITPLHNPTRQQMETAIYSLFANRQKDDLLLLYFSGHGVVDEGGNFYLTSHETRKDNGNLVPPTAVAARTIQAWMEQSRSQRQVVILDSCFSGAFARGVQAKDSGTLNLDQFLGGRGRAILTATTSTQYALTQPGLDLSVYTHYLVEGLRTGGADQDDDGFIAVEELHHYASSKVKEAAPAMTPEFYPVREGYAILLAKSPKDDPHLKYRKQVRLLAEEDEGNFSVINRACLDVLQSDLGISPDDATLMETEELEPYRQRHAKVDRYRTTFKAALAQQYPLRDRDRVQLQRLQKLLSLRDEDILAIEAPFLAAKQTDYERQQQEAAAERQRQAERQRAEAERLRQAEAERQRQAPQPPAQPKAQGWSTRPIEIETVTLKLEKVGLFGRQSELVTNRRRCQVEVYTETLAAGITLDMVRVLGGEFLMGTPQAEIQRLKKEYNVDWFDCEHPQHRVTVPEFFMGKTPITQAQYQAIVGTNPSHFTENGANRPVEQVSWKDAMKFCQKLSEKTGKAYRLPSEAEWEYACRAGTTTPFHFGATITPDLVNYNGNYPYGNAPKGKYRQQTTEVGSFLPNGFGLHDLHGNVWEWCADNWHDNYQGAPIDGSVWKTSDFNNDRHVIRGGSWAFNPRNCRSAYRIFNRPANRNDVCGFRVVVCAPRTL